MWNWLKKIACIRDDAYESTSFDHHDKQLTDVTERNIAFKPVIYATTITAQLRQVIDANVAFKMSHPRLKVDSDDLNLPLVLWLIILGYIDDPYLKGFGSEHISKSIMLPLISVYMRDNIRINKQPTRELFFLSLTNRFFYSLLKYELCMRGKRYFKPLSPCVPGVFYLPRDNECQVRSSWQYQGHQQNTFLQLTNVQVDDEEEGAENLALL